MHKHVLSDAKSKSGSLGDASVSDLEQGYVSLEKDSPRKAMLAEYGMSMDSSDFDGGVLGRPNGMER